MASGATCLLRHVQAGRSLTFHMYMLAHARGNKQVIHVSHASSYMTFTRFSGPQPMTHNSHVLSNAAFSCFQVGKATASAAYPTSEMVLDLSREFLLRELPLFINDFIPRFVFFGLHHVLTPRAYHFVGLFVSLLLPDLVVSPGSFTTGS